MERATTGYHQDAAGGLVAELDCGHNQHVRHRPPFQVRPWMLTPPERAGRIGTTLGCPLCERAEPPQGLRKVRSSPFWDENTLPPGLRQAHRIGPGTWARIHLHDGNLRFFLTGHSKLQVDRGPGDEQDIPPGGDHDTRAVGMVRVSIDFLAVDRQPRDVDPSPPNQGGDPACWTALICPDCGIVDDGSPHKGGCAFPPAPGPLRRVSEERERR